MRKKPKESEDEVFSDAVAEFSEGVGPNKSVGDASNLVSTSKMVAEDEMNSSQTLKDREILDRVPLSSSLTENRIAESSIAAETIDQSGSEQESKNSQEFVNLETDFGTPSSSSSTGNRKVENSFVAETAIDQSGNEQDSKINPEYGNLETDFGTPTSSSSAGNRKVESSVVAENTVNQSGTEQETKINREFVNFETNFRNGDSMILLHDHMNATATGDLYPIEPEMVIAAPVENVPQCSLPSPDRSYDEKKNEGFGLCNNLAEIAASSGKVDNNKFEPLPKTEETVDIPTEPTAHNEILPSMADVDSSIHTATPPSVVSDVKPFASTQVTSSNTGKETESCSSFNLLETNKIKEGNDNVHPPSVLSEVNVVDRPKALVKDSEDPKEVKLTNCVIQEDPREGVSSLGDNFKYPNTKESYPTLQAEPFDQASEGASFDMKRVENRQKQESGGSEVLVDVEGARSKNSGWEVEEVLIQEVDPTQIKEGILSENEKQDKSQTLSDAAILRIDSIPIPLASLSPEVETVAPSKNSLNSFSENVAEILFDENSVAAPTGNQKSLDQNEVGTGAVILADDDNKAGACGRHLEESVQVRLSANVHENDDSGVGNKDKFDNPDVAGVENNEDPPEEKFSMGVDYAPESITNSREKKCIAVEEDTADGSPRKLSGTGSAVLVPCISEANADDRSCCVGDFDSVQNTSDIQAKEKANLLLVSKESVMGRSDASQDGDAVRITSEPWQDDGVKTDVKPQLTSSLLDASVDASSRTDSLEGHWGSVSVLSTQSDLPAVVDSEVTPRARAEAEETDLKKADAMTERQHSDRSDLFEPPSFMTLVEPNGGGMQNSASSEIQTAQNRQQPNSASLQPGWFPSYTHVANDSPGRKKNEAIIAKVTNWSAGKPHTALKNLLDDAALENKQKSSPTRKENLASMIQKDEKATKNGPVDTMVDSVTRPRSPSAQLGNKEIANEWNSPARYPSDIRRERRKGKPYWAQFVCCSSVH
ncbi:uncharacterized protein LOC111009240 isoform X2 [Momordica charantia]|nr:uncharacterized protein LOC111009240 isoform X2 [Momordica charantia]